jgi:hypothetical protein
MEGDGSQHYSSDLAGRGSASRRGVLYTEQMVASSIERAKGLSSKKVHIRETKSLKGAGDGTIWLLFVSDRFPPNK